MRYTPPKPRTLQQMAGDSRRETPKVLGELRRFKEHSRGVRVFVGEVKR